MRIILNKVDDDRIDLVWSDQIYWSKSKQRGLIFLINGDCYWVDTSEQDFINKQKESLVTGYMDLSEYSSVLKRYEA